MPLYEFTCSGCNGTRETLQSFGANPPDCCGIPMRRKPSIPFRAVMVKSQKDNINDGLNEGIPDHPNKAMLEQGISGGFKDKPVIGKGF